MAETITINIKVGGTRDLDRGLRNAEKSVESFMKKLSNQASIKNIAIGTAIGDLISSGIKVGLDKAVDLVEFGAKSIFNVLKTSLFSAANLQTVRIGYETLLGGGTKGVKLAKELLGDLEKFALKTPFNLTELQQVGQQLLSFGIGAKKLIPTMRTLGNVAALTGRADAMGRLTYAFGQVKAQGRLLGTELRQLTELGIPIREFLAKRLGIPLKDLNDKITDGAVSFKIFNQAMKDLEKSRADGAMDRMAKTLPGVISNLEDLRDKFLRTIGGITSEGDLIKGGFLDMASQKLTKFADILSKNEPAITKFFGNVSKKIGNFIDVQGNKLIKNLPEYSEKFEAFFNGAVEFAPKFIDALETVVSSIDDFIKAMDILSTPLQEAFNVGKKAGEVFLPTDGGKSKPWEAHARNAKTNMQIIQLELQNTGIKFNELDMKGKAALANIAASSKSPAEATKKLREYLLRAGNDGQKALAKARVEASNLAGQTNRATNAAASLQARMAALNYAKNTLSNIRKFLPFANGGVIPKAQNGMSMVPGNSRFGDKTLIRANAGEMILNKGQQSALFSLIKQLSSNPSRVNNFNAPISFGGSRPQGQQMNIFNQLLMNR